MFLKVPLTAQNNLATLISAEKLVPGSSQPNLKPGRAEKLPPGPPELPVPPSRHPKSTTGPDHDGVRNMLREIGEMEGRVAEVEYHMDGWRLDVAWKRIAIGIPSHAFEVQIGGNFYEALAKLKHAYDKWNSKPVLVTTEKYEREAHALLTGSFHEIRHVTSVVNWRTIVSLYRLLRRTWKLREEVGLR